MKVANFITHTLLFLAAWFGLSVASWDASQGLVTSTLMPWILPTITNIQSQETVAFALAASLSMIGSCLAALLALVLLLAGEALFYRLRQKALSKDSSQS